MKGPIAALMMLGLLAGGCAPTFCGEWLEVPQTLAEDQPAPIDDTFRVALQFDPVSTVRSGFYSEQMGVVDDNSVQADTYFIFDGGTRAQFGAVIARLDGDRLTAIIGNRPAREFTRVKGRSIFPPHVKLPQFSAQAGPGPEVYALAAP